jgi:hypothetical protein
MADPAGPKPFWARWRVFAPSAPMAMASSGRAEPIETVPTGSATAARQMGTAGAVDHPAFSRRNCNFDQIVDLQ